MNPREVMDFCEGLPCVTSDCVFGRDTVCYRIGNKIFAMVCPEGIAGALRILREDEAIPRESVVPMVTLRCDAAFGDFYRRQYPGAVYRPYHCPPAQQPYSVTVLLNGGVPGGELRQMLGHAYQTILHKLPKRLQADIAAQSQG